jgi:hypothetical protein
VTAVADWFRRLIAVREKHPFGFAALFAIVCFVALARAQLEILTAHERYTLQALLNNIAFYLLSAYLFAVLACALTRKSLEHVSGIVAFGVFLGVLPPVIDTLISGPGHGYYRYVADGFARWSWTLVNADHYSLGEAVTLWLLVLGLPGYVLTVTRSAPRTIAALVLSYAAVTFLAMAPSTWALMLAERLSPFGRGSWFLCLSLLQLTLAQACYLVLRPKLARRLFPRLLHALPFVGLAMFGSSLAEWFAPELRAPGRHALAVLSAGLILQLCVVALVQNDAFDAADDGRDVRTVQREDAHFFTTVAVLEVLLMLVAMPHLGVAMGLFLCASTVYSYDFYRAKRFFPSNYKCEGVWGWSSFVLGGSSAVTLRPEVVLPGSWLLASFAVFGGWSVFNVFKDYKDIRSDHRARVQTLYTLALRRGIGLRRLHNCLRAALLPATLIPAVGLALSGADTIELVVVTLLAVLAFAVVLGRPPRASTVKAYLWTVTVFIAALTAVVERGLARAEHPARSSAPLPEPTARSGLPAMPSDASASERRREEPGVAVACTAGGLWREPARQLSFVQWRQLTLVDYSGVATASGCYPVAAPETTEQVQQLVRAAAALRAPIRIRGAGHSMNGSSLPQATEILLSTAGLNELRFERRGQVVAQAGLSMHAVEGNVRAHGLHVPVINDGPPAPTVGGYVSAGGLGAGSSKHGGFWANVAAVTLVDGAGELRRIARDDPDFLWLFGAMGQLGVVVEVELDVVAADEQRSSAKDPYEARKRIHLPAAQQVASPSGPRRVWFTLLLSPDEVETARGDLAALQERFGGALQMLQPYTYVFKESAQAPPLFFGRSGPLTAVGIWAEAADAKVATLLDQAFEQLCARRGYRRYIQTELTRGADAYRRYFGERTYAAFLQVKRRLDPEFLFNRDTVFSYRVR